MFSPCDSRFPPIKIDRRDMHKRVSDFSFREGGHRTPAIKCSFKIQSDIFRFCSIKFHITPSTHCISWNDLSLALKQTSISLYSTMLTQLLKFEISILPTLRHKFVCCVIVVLRMRTWCFINKNLIVYSEQGFQNVSRAVNPGGSTQERQL